MLGLLAGAAALFCSVAALAYQVTHAAVTGTVVSASTGAALQGVSVSVPDVKVSTTTDTKGTFTITDLPIGPHTIVVSCVGYGLAKRVVETRPGVTVSLTIPLAEGTATYTDEVTVHGDPFRGANGAVAAQQTATSADIQDLRGVLADDPLRAIQALPGVATGNDFRSEFSVRGSDYRHIGLSLDGITTPWLVHTVGNFESYGSVALINGDIVDNVTLEAGAHPQDRIGRTGGRLDYGIRDGSRAATRLRGALSMTSGSIVAEGPIGSARRGSWLVSIRDSYVQWLLKKLKYTGATLGFMDIQSKAVFDVTARQHVEFTLVGGRSELDQEAFEPGGLITGQNRAGLAMLSWRSTFTSFVLTQRAAVIGDRFDADQVIPSFNISGPIANSSSTEAVYKANLSWSVRPSLVAHMGTDVQLQRGGASASEIVPIPGGFTSRPVTSGGRAWTGAGYGRVSWTATHGPTLDGGARVARSTLTDQVATTPWLLSVWPVGQAWSVRAGASISSQVPDFDQATGTLAGPRVRNETAQDFDMGLEYRPRTTVRLQVTAYDREERHVLRLEDHEMRRLADGTLSRPDRLTPLWANALRGASRGMEFVLQRRAAGGLSGWIGYAYGRTRYTDAGRGETFAADFDQRHTLNVYGQERLSSTTSISAKLRVGSNFPLPGYFIGDPAGALEVGSTRNTVRLPAYARLDLRANHAFNFSRRRLTLFVEVVNVLNRTNYIPSQGLIHLNGRAESFTATLFPFLPSVGLVIEF
jgi:hypothetical protein